MSVYTRRGKDKRMNKLKRILSIIISVVMIASMFCVNAIAEDTKELTAQQQDAVKKIALLAQLEIFDYEYGWDETMYRIDFAQAMSRLINCPVNGYQVKDLYDDVKDGDPGYGEVSVMYDMDIMNGKGNRIFAPDDYIAVPEAITAMVRLLGYTAKAQAKGGYPGGYTLTATDLGLLKNVSYEGCDEGITAGALAEIIYNALDVEMVDSYILDNSGIKVTGLGRRTILESYLGLKKGEGLLSAFEIFSLSSPLSSALELDEVKIDDETYKYEFEGLETYFGYEIEYFYREKTGGETYSTVLFASKKTNSKEVTIYSDDIDTADSKNIKTKKSSGGKTYKIDSDAIVTQNGLSVPQMKSEYIPKNGYIKMISNNGSSYDVLMVYDFQSLVVASSSRGKISFKYGLDVDGIKLLDLNDSEKLSYVLYKNETILPDDIKKGDVISIATNTAGGIFAVISRETVSGEITMTKDNPFEVCIDNYTDKLYKVNDKFHEISEKSLNETEPLEVGKSSGFALDFMGKICGMGDVASKQFYGYLYGAKSAKVLSDDYQVRIFSNEKNGWADYKLADKCDLNGVRTDNGAIISNLQNYITDMDSRLHKSATGTIDDLYPPIVKFTVNVKGEIKSIVNNWVEGNDPTKINENTLVLSKPFWYSVFQWAYDFFTTFSSGAANYRNLPDGSTPACYAGDAVCFQIPTDKESTDDYKVGTPNTILPKDFNTPRPYLFYDLDDYGVAGLVVYMPAGGGTSIQTSQPIYGVKSVSEGNECAILYLVNGEGVENRYETKDDPELIEQCLNFKCGDFVQFSVDSNQKIIAVAEYFSYDVSKFNANDYVAGGKFYQRMKDTQSVENYGIGFMRCYGSKFIESISGSTNSGTVLKFKNSDYNYSKCPVNIVVFDGEEYYKATSDEIVEGDYLLFRVGHQVMMDVFIIRNSEFTDQEVYLINK